MAPKTIMTIKIDVETGDVVEVLKNDNANDKARREGSPQNLKGKGGDFAGTVEIIPTALVLTKSSPGCVTYYHRGQYYVV